MSASRKVCVWTGVGGGKPHSVIQSYIYYTHTYASCDVFFSSLRTTIVPAEVERDRAASATVVERQRKKNVKILVVYLQCELCTVCVCVCVCDKRIIYIYIYDIHTYTRMYTHTQYRNISAWRTPRRDAKYLATI